MGKRRNYRFPHGINGVDRFFYPRLHPHPLADPMDVKGAGYYDMTSQHYGFDMYSGTDIQGSYTGIAEDGSMPIQDADDL